VEPAITLRGIPEALFKNQRWNESHQNGHSNHYRSVNRGKTIDEFLLSSLVLLSFIDHGNNPLNRIIFSQTADAHFQHALPIHRP